MDTVKDFFTNLLANPELQEILHMEINEGHGSGVTLWVLLVSIGIIYLAMLLIKGKNKHRDMKVRSKTGKVIDVQEALLQSQSLTAVLFSQEGEEVIEYQASLAKDRSLYHLKIDRIQDGNSQSLTDMHDTSLDTIAQYLRSDTKFVVGDFQ